VVTDLQNGGPIDGFGTSSRGIPKAGIRVVFSFKNVRKQLIFVSGNVSSRVNNETLINQLHFPYYITMKCVFI